MKHALMMGMGVMVAVSVWSADYYYRGGTAPWDDVASYTVDRQTPAELPGAADNIVLSAGKTALVDDDTIAFFSRVDRVFLFGEDIVFTIDISTNATFGCWLGDQGGHNYTNTWVVKKGPGELFFSKPWSGSSNSYSYDASVDVQGGAYHAAPTVSEISKHRFHAVRVAAGTAFYGVTNNTTVISSLSGAGIVTNDSPVAYRTTSFTLQINGSSPFATPAEFSGQIFGDWIVYYASYVNFTGTGSAVKELQVAGYGGGLQGRMGVSSFASVAESPFGRLGIDCRGPIRTVYLGEPGGIFAANYTLWDTADAPVTIDAGEKGGWQLTEGVFTVRDATAKQQRLELTGEDTAAPCVLSNKISELSGGAASVYLTKSGSGVWKIYDNGTTCLSGAIAVKNGTLEFDTIAEQGRRCALGTAARLFEDKCAEPANLTAVDYAWLLGTAGDVSKVGTLSYAGDVDMQLESRKTALAGAGRLRTKAGSLFKYSAGISGLGAGEKAMHFENGAGATNVVSGVSDGTAGAVLSVVKEGAGVYALSGDLGFSGDLVVKGGELTLKDINNAKYEWYRYTFKENRCSSTNAAYADYVVNHGDYYAGQVTRAIVLNEIGLYSSDGVRVNSPGNTVNDVPTNASHLALAPKEVAVVGAEKQMLFGSSNGSQDVRRLFENGESGGCTFKTFWRDRMNYPQFDKPESWIVVYQRLAEGAAEASAYDVCYDGPSGSDRFKGGPTAWTIEASADGVTWQKVAETNNVVFNPTDSYAWLSNDPSEAWAGTGTRPESVAHPNKFPLSASRQQGVYARPRPRSVGVAAQAKLVVEGSPITANGVTLGTDGLGVVSGVNLAAEGELSLACDLAAQPDKVFFPADFSQFGNADKVRGYRVVVNGGSVPRAYVALVKSNGVTLMRKGLVLVVR